jgi:RNA polymerase sigma-70 factor (ECF subfamily)
MAKAMPLQSHFFSQPFAPIWFVTGNETLQVSCRIFLAYLRHVDAAPSQPVEQSMAKEPSAVTSTVHPALLDELWHESEAGKWGLERNEFDRIVLLVAVAQNCGLEAGATAWQEQQAALFKGLRLADLVLAKACAAGNERAWERFVALYGQQLTRAAIAISGNETVGRDLADAFYGELYGLTEREGERKCPLDSYRGRGSLIGWLRTTLAQRYVDHYRRTFREQALDEMAHDAPAHDSVAEPDHGQIAMLRKAVNGALCEQPAEERFLLAAYYLDEKTLAEIAVVLRVHEATISRRLKRATEAVRKRLLRNLEKSGMSRRAAEEVLGTDPRDVDLGDIDLRMDFKKLMQPSAQEPFREQVAPTAAASGNLAGTLLSDPRATLSEKKTEG